jgi:hypothetical protein
MLPFSREQFFAVFADYNTAVWPMQIVAYLVAAGLLGLMLRPSRGRDRLIGAGLALMWAWTGIAYHVLHFASINRAAWLFGAMFVLQAALLLHACLFGPSLAFAPARGPRAALGWALALYAVVAYPLLGLAAGHRAAELPLVGITPCPVTIFTFGLLLLARMPLPRRLLVIPIGWSLIGGSAAFLLGVVQDWLLLASGIAVLVVVHRARRRAASAVVPG